MVRLNRRVDAHRAVFTVGGIGFVSVSGIVDSGFVGNLGAARINRFHGKIIDLSEKIELVIRTVDTAGRIQTFMDADARDEEAEIIGSTRA